MASSPVALPVLPLNSPVTVLSGIGPERAAQLARLSCLTIHDLLRHRPQRHEDRRRFSPVADLQLGEASLVHGKIVASGTKYYAHRTKSVVEIIVDDGTARLHCRWWNQPYMQRRFANGDEVLVFGKPVALKPRTIDHPETEVLVADADPDRFIHLDRWVPVYPLTEGLPQRWLRSMIWRLLTAYEWPADPNEVAWPGLPSRSTAFRWLHFPDDLSQVEAARQRLALDEFLELQLSLKSRRQNLLANATARPCGGNNRWIKPWLHNLGFTLTPGQTRVLQVLRKELSGGTPMRRLLQGDVGTGKTVVAGACALMSLESGFNVALMAPTEILALQHWTTFRQWFEPLGIPVQLRTGARKEGEQAAAPYLVIGTHALIEAEVEIDNLGLVMIDEQHRFGVAQREKLVRKGDYPHLLVMTATPIPRTLGLTIYGDLDISILDGRPAGRGTVKTFVRAAASLPKVYDFIRQKLTEGRQAYVVYPLVEESDRVDWKAVTREYDELKRTFAPFEVGLLHGRLAAEEKDNVMQRFRANRLQVLVTTSVIEVGVDVANATVMLIENAEQFGLAQLHQLRGRIGRGSHAAYCILVAAARTPEAQQRLQVLADTNDGFRIAEADLTLRGPGELLGDQQSGLPAFRFGDLAKDLALVERARQTAARLLGAPEPH